MRDLMAARGPDGHGEWASDDRQIWLGHRRLSIIDLSERGAQPMRSADGQIVITFNGEIYNYKALRGRLESKGHVFRSGSDTEVLIELYREMGPDMVRDLRGMFAFALWDAALGRLLLARDPYGIKPLYYAVDRGEVTFASSVKALIGSGLVDCAFDPAGLAGFYVLGSVPEPWTMYRAVRSLPAGTTMAIDGDGIQAPRQYHSISRVWTESEALAEHNEARLGGGVVDAAALRAEVRAALLDSVRHHLVADVPVGAFLSGGVDSGALVGLMRDAGQAEIETITLTYDEFEGSANDEAPLAAMVARHYNTRHHTRRVSADEFAQDLPKIMAAMDQPSIDGVNSWFVAKAAHEIGLKVAISGVGGDELLGGYDTFRNLPRLRQWFGLPSYVPGMVSLMRNMVGITRGGGVALNPKYAELMTHGGTLPGAYLLQRGLFLPYELQRAFADPAVLREGLEALDPAGLIADAVLGGPRSNFAKIATLESTFYLRNQLLRDADWASMAHSLELRTPLVDSALLERVAPFLTQRWRPSGKSLLAHAPQMELPEAVVTRKKTGFGIPVERWLAHTGLRLESQNAVGDRTEPFSRRWARYVADVQTRADVCAGPIALQN